MAVQPKYCSSVFDKDRPGGKDPGCGWKKPCADALTWAGEPTPDALGGQRHARPLLRMPVASKCRLSGGGHSQGSPTGREDPIPAAKEMTLQSLVSRAPPG